MQPPLTSCYVHLRRKENAERIPTITIPSWEQARTQSPVMMINHPYNFAKGLETNPTATCGPNYTADNSRLTYGGNKQKPQCHTTRGNEATAYISMPGR